MNMYIASNTEDGGVYRYNIEDGLVEFCEKTAMPLPMYIDFDGDNMYVVLRAPFENSEESGIICYSLENGKPVNPSEFTSTEGLCGCHITADNGDIYAANYLSGSVKKAGGKLVQSIGEGPNKPRQDTAHLHQTVITPDGKYVCAADLGTDSILIYDRELNFVSKANVPAGHGARHMVFNKNLLYCVNELAATVTVFKYNDGSLTALDTYTSLPCDFKDKNTAAAIRVSGEYLYISNRGHDSIVCYKINGEQLELIQRISCGGISPRDFNITPDGKMLVCTNETSDNVTFYSISDGFLEKKDMELSIKAPLCIVFR